VVLNIHPGLRFAQGLISFSRAVGGATARAAGSATMEWFASSQAGRAYFNRVTLPRALKALEPTPPKPGRGVRARGAVTITAAAASGAILGAAVGIGVSKLLWGESGEQTAREFYGGAVTTTIEEGWSGPGIVARDWWDTVSTIPDNIFHD